MTSRSETGRRRVVPCGRARVSAIGRVAGLLVGVALGAFTTTSVAQVWPSKTIRLILPAAPGGSSDPMARMVAEELRAGLNQPVVVENRPGANGNIGASLAAKSPADGYTLLLGWPGTLVSAVTLYGSKPFNPEKDFEHIVLVGTVPNVILVNQQMPVKTVDELTAYARRNPGKLNFGSTGSGSSYHLAGELYKKDLGVFMVHVPYTSPGAVLTDLIGDRLQLAFPGVTAGVPFVKDGQLRALAVMADRRSEVLPDVPTTKELGYPKLVSETWFGILAPKGTPKEITSKINEVINAALKTPAFRDRLQSMGYTVLGGTSEQFSNLLREDIVKWGEVVKFSGAKID